MAGCEGTSLLLGVLWKSQLSAKTVSGGDKLEDASRYRLHPLLQRMDVLVTAPEFPALLVPGPSRDHHSRSESGWAIPMPGYHHNGHSGPCRGRSYEVSR